MSFDRRTFLRGTALGVAASAASPEGALAQAATAVPPTPAKATTRALVLSGGGAYGAFEAGVVQALHDGGMTFDFVCGTSAGALNAALFSTDPDRGLYDAWSTIGAREIIRLQKRLAVAVPAQFNPVPATENAHGVATRAYDAVSFLVDAASGSTKSIFETQPIKDALTALLLEADRETPKPFKLDVLWSAVDLQGGCSRSFIRPASPDSTALKLLNARTAPQPNGIQNGAPPIDVSAATGAAFIEAIRASAAIPLVFDPASYGQSSFVDGGVLNNVPTNLARLAGADEVWTVQLTPDVYYGKAQNNNVIQLIANIYTIMTQHLLVDGITLGLLVDQVQSKVGFAQLPARHGTTTLLQALASLADLPPLTMKAFTPDVSLAGNGLDFNNQCSINANFNAGYAAIKGSTQKNFGFVDWVAPSFDCAIPRSEGPAAASTSCPTMTIPGSYAPNPGVLDPISR